jgi:spore coat protein U-like protein
LCLLCSCSVSSTPIAFGSYNPMSSSSRDSDGSVLFTCGGLVGGLVSYDVALGKGLNSTTFSPRRMASGANRLDYDLYTSSAYSSIWGDGTGGSQKVSGTVTILLVGGTTRELIVYGRIPGSQTAVKAGSYSDALLITVTYN